MPDCATAYQEVASMDPDIIKALQKDFPLNIERMVEYAKERVKS